MHAGIANADYPEVLTCIINLIYNSYMYIELIHVVGYLVPSFTFATVIRTYGLVYVFSLRFLGHRRWLRATMFTFTLFTVIVKDFMYWALVEGPKTKPYRGCTEIVQRCVRGIVGRSCDFFAVTVTYPRRSYRDRTISVQRLCEDRKVKVSSLNATYNVFKGYDLTIWKICITPR